MRSIHFVVVVAGTGLSGGCGGSDRAGTTEPERPAVASVRILPAELTLRVDQAVDAHAQTRAAGGALLNDRAISWRVSDTSVVGLKSIDASRVEIRARASGRAFVIAASEGAADSVPVQVPIEVRWIGHARFRGAWQVTTHGETVRTETREYCGAPSWSIGDYPLLSVTHPVLITRGHFSGRGTSDHRSPPLAVTGSRVSVEYSISGSFDDESLVLRYSATGTVYGSSAAGEYVAARYEHSATGAAARDSRRAELLADRRYGTTYWAHEARIYHHVGFGLRLVEEQRGFSGGPNCPLELDLTFTSPVDESVLGH
jgi:hypothetical protein